LPAGFDPLLICLYANNCPFEAVLSENPVGEHLNFLGFRGEPGIASVHGGAGVPQSGIVKVRDQKADHVLVVFA